MKMFILVKIIKNTTDFGQNFKHISILYVSYLEVITMHIQIPFLKNFAS